MSDNNKVTPIRPDIPGLQGYKIQGLPYTGPSAAVKDILDRNNFDETAKGRGWIELRIVAQFSEVGAMFHTVQAAEVVMRSEQQEEGALPDDSGAAVAADTGASEGPSASLKVLVQLAITNGRNPRYYVGIASLEQMAILDEELKDATDDELRILASGWWRDVRHVVERLNCVRSHTVLAALVEEGSE